MFFGLTACLSSIGAGSIAATALVAPMAMTVAARAHIPQLLMAILVGHGAVAGGLSPFALTGVVVNGQMNRIGMSGYAWQTLGLNLLANSAVAICGYLLLGGRRLFRDTTVKDVITSPVDPKSTEPFVWRQWLTLSAVATLIVGVLAGGVDVGLGAFAVSVVLIVCRAVDQNRALLAIPWGVIVMVSGVTILVSLVERTGGMKVFASLLAHHSNAQCINGLMAFVTGIVSVFSSTSGVVLPAFLPTVPELAEQLGAAPLPIAMSINIGSGLVDVSPVSTIGALCLAAASAGEDRQRLFVGLLVWGLSMSALGGLMCHLYFYVW